MFDVSVRTATIRLSILAGAAALAMGSLTATAQAFPVAPAAPESIGTMTDVRYDDGGYPHHMRRHHGYGHHRYGQNAHPRHPGHAGVYDCGPGGKATRLSRRACGGNDRFQHFRGY